MSEGDGSIKEPLGDKVLFAQEQMLCRKRGRLTSDLCFASRALLHCCPGECRAGCKGPEAGSKNVADSERNQLLQRFTKSSQITVLLRKKWRISYDDF